MNERPSLTAAQAKLYQKLLQKKYREGEGKFIVEGVHLVQELLDSNWEVDAIVASTEFLEKRGSDTVSRGTMSKRVRIIQASERELTRLSDTTTSQGVVAIAYMKKSKVESLWKTTSEQSVIVVLNDVSDPGNAGTIIRTCDWFGIDGVLLDQHSVELYNPKVVRSTMGSMFHLPVITGVALPAILREAKKIGYSVYSTALTGGKPPVPGIFGKKSLIVFGNEARGVNTGVVKEATEILTIPKRGHAESLNIAIACGIVLSSINREK